MTETRNSKYYDLEERTALFAERCRDFVNGDPALMKEKVALAAEAIELRKIFTSILGKSVDR